MTLSDMFWEALRTALVVVGSLLLFAWILVETYWSDEKWKGLVVVRKVVLYPVAIIALMLGLNSLSYGTRYFFMPWDDVSAPLALWALVNLGTGVLLMILGAGIWGLGMLKVSDAWALVHRR